MYDFSLSLLIGFFYFIYKGDTFGEPSPSYSYRNFVFLLKYVLGGNVFIFCRISFLGDAFGPGCSGLASARLPLGEPSPAHPYRGFN